MITQDDKLTAMLIQPLNGKDREPTYAVFVRGSQGNERREVVGRAAFWRIHDAAGDAEYTEHGYWSYDGCAIEWADVFAEGR